MATAFEPQKVLYLALKEYWRVDPRFAKALCKRGADLRYFDYRHEARQLAPWGLNKKFGRKRMVAAVAQQIADWKPDLVWICKGDLFTGEDLARFRAAHPAMKMVLWFGDWPQAAPDLFPHCPHLDGIFVTHGGPGLERFTQAGAPLAAFTPNPVDPEVQFPRTPLPYQRHRVLFTGRDNGEPFRRHVVEGLRRTYGDGFGLYGYTGTIRLRGVDYYQLLSGAGVALSISCQPDVKWYHSDRLTDLLACGAPTVVHYGEGMEQLFTEGEHCLWGRTEEEVLGAVARLDADKQLQGKLRYQGMRAVHQLAHYEKVTRAILEMLEHGSADVEWCDVRTR